jgi:hypothetical protein
VVTGPVNPLRDGALAVVDHRGADHYLSGLNPLRLQEHLANEYLDWIARFAGGKP